MRALTSTPLLLLLALLVFCACASSPKPAPSSEIDLTTPAGALPPEPAPLAAPDSPGLRPCKVADPHCTTPPADAASEELPPLDPNRRYVIPVGAEDPQNGAELAPVTLVVFSDFQCPHCRNLSGTLAALLFEYGDRVRVVWKDLPLEMHPYALPAALLAREAFAKGGDRAFWQVHDALFVAQPELSDATLSRIAERFELSWPPLERYQGAIDETQRQVRALNIRSTPTTFVNGRPLIGAQPISVFQQSIEAELAAPSAP